MTGNGEEILRFVVAHDEGGARLDRYLASQAADVSRARFQTLIADGRVSVNRKTVRRTREKLRGGDEIAVVMPPPAAAGPVAQDIALDIVHEDEHLIVIDKPAGMVVHPAPGHGDGTLVNALLHHCRGSLSGIGGVRRPGIVHRLDKDTSGLLVAAKTDVAHAGLAEQFAAHGRDGRLERAYLALVWGAPDRQRGMIDERLARSRHNRQKIAVVRGENGRSALTHYRLMECFPPQDARPVASLVECRLETGRTHQIRVHMAHMGCPVMGDEVYGAGFKASVNRLPPEARKALASLGRQALHAAILGFEHPVSGEKLRFQSPLPQDMRALLDVLRYRMKCNPNNSRRPGD